uniref:Molybdopterin biosynthesis protein n=1 Tax=Dermonema virens TaxID=1077399 RepID=A0A1G4NRZ1_9FLOR|nr:Molybdopterin biosynthesis protein [Dermonema virens]SCW21428.1 Molybdopterin biosynthesis protein [Dermonema virens]
MNVNTSQFSEYEYQIYAKQIVLPEIQSTGQIRLKQARVLAIGAGGLGSSSLMYLASCGIGNIGIIDHDIVERSNLHRQILYDTLDVGSFKSNCAKNTLKKRNPLCQLRVFKNKFTVHNAYTIAKEYDIILDNTDNYDTRWLISNVCQQLHKVHIYGAISSFEGQVSVFNYQNGPNYNDLKPYNNTGNSNICDTRGVIGILPGIIGMFQATEVLKIILGLGNIISGHIVVYNILEAKFKKIKLVSRKRSNINILKTAQHNQHKQLFTKNIQKISLTDIKNFILTNKKSIYLIDIRNEAEYNLGHLHGAINIPLQKLCKQYNLQQIKTRSCGYRIVIYCNSLSRSYIANKMLKSVNTKCSIINTSF